MTDKSFLKEVSKESGYSIKELKQVLDAVEIQLKKRMIEEDGQIKILDFIVSSVTIPPRTVRDPHINSTIEIGERKRIKVKLRNDWKMLQKYYSENEDEK